MKKLLAIIGAVALCFTAGCSNNKNTNSNNKGGYAVVVQTESVPRQKVETVGTQTVEQTTQTESSTAAPASERITTAGTSATTADLGGGSGAVKKKNIDVVIETKAVFTAAGSDLNGVLSFSAKGFTFVPDGGTAMEFPLDKILLVVVSKGTDKELLGLIAANDQFQFYTENGYAHKLSEYIIISEAQDIKSSGILLSGF